MKETALVHALPLRDRVSPTALPYRRRSDVGYRHRAIASLTLHEPKASTLHNVESVVDYRSQAVACTLSYCATDNRRQNPLTRTRRGLGFAYPLRGSFAKPQTLKPLERQLEGSKKKINYASLTTSVASATDRSCQWYISTIDERRIPWGGVGGVSPPAPKAQTHGPFSQFFSEMSTLHNKLCQVCKTFAKTEDLVRLRRSCHTCVDR